MKADTTTAPKKEDLADVSLAPWLGFVERVAPTHDDEDLREALRTKPAEGEPLTEDQVGALLTRAAAVRAAAAASAPTKQEARAAREAAEARWDRGEAARAERRRNSPIKAVFVFPPTGASPDDVQALADAEYARRYGRRPPATFRHMLTPKQMPVIPTAPGRVATRRERHDQPSRAAARASGDDRPRCSCRPGCDLELPPGRRKYFNDQHGQNARYKRWYDLHRRGSASERIDRRHLARLDQFARDSLSLGPAETLRAKADELAERRTLLRAQLPHANGNAPALRDELHQLDAEYAETWAAVRVAEAGAAA